MPSTQAASRLPGNREHCPVRASSKSRRERTLRLHPAMVAAPRKGPYPRTCTDPFTGVQTHPTRRLLPRLLEEYPSGAKRGGFVLTEKTFCFNGPASTIRFPLKQLLHGRGGPKSYVSSADISTIRRNFCARGSRQPDGTDFQKQIVSPLVIGATSNRVAGHLIRKSVLLKVGPSGRACDG